MSSIRYRRVINQLEMNKKILTKHTIEIDDDWVSTNGNTWEVPNMIGYLEIEAVGAGGWGGVVVHNTSTSHTIINHRYATGAGSGGSYSYSKLIFQEGTMLKFELGNNKKINREDKQTKVKIYNTENIIMRADGGQNASDTRQVVFSIDGTPTGYPVGPQLLNGVNPFQPQQNIGQITDYGKGGNNAYNDSSMLRGGLGQSGLINITPINIPYTKIYGGNGQDENFITDKVDYQSPTPNSQSLTRSNSNFGNPGLIYITYYTL